MGHARGGGEYDITDADIEKFYQETMGGSGGVPPKGSVVGELIVKAFYGELKPTGFERYSGQWKGPPPGAIGKGWVWLAADMSPGGPAMQMYTSVPYGKRPCLIAKKSNIDELFEKADWSLMDKRIDTTMGGPQVIQR